MIINNKRNEMVKFDSIKNGDVFILYEEDEDIYMKIEGTYCNDNGDFDNAVNLANGTLYYFEYDKMVQPIKCELIID